MNVPDIRIKLLASLGGQICTKHWHWFKFHFSRLPPTPFGQDLIESLVVCEEKCPGFAEEFISSLANLADREKDLDHYDQLLQKLGELLVIDRCARVIAGDAKMEIEPSVQAADKRADVVITSPLQTLAIEIKAPAISKISKLRVAGSTQLVSRTFPKVEPLAGSLGGQIILPRDNAVKDFLISSDEKFSVLRQRGNCHTVLVIVWDDYVHEAISALVHERSGLFTPNSFAKDASQKAMPFANVDGVIIVRHLHYFVNSAAERPLPDRTGPFDFGDERALPNVFVPNPRARNQIPDDVLDAFRAIPYDDELLSKMADYRPKDLVWWIKT